MEKANQPEFKQKWFNIFNLKKKSWYYKGDLDLKDRDVSAIIWPDNLEIDGNLWLRGSNIKKLPDNLTVAWRLYLDDCKEIIHLPKNLKCSSLDIIGTDIKEIKKDVIVNMLLSTLSISDIKFEEGFFCERIYTYLQIQTQIGINKNLFDSLPKLLTRYFEGYNNDINGYDYYFNTNINRRIIRRNLRNTNSLYYRFFKMENKKELIKGLYGKR